MLGILLSQGDDALKSLYEIIIYRPPILGGSAIEELRIRTTSFTPPAMTVGTYEIFYGPQKANKPSGSYEYTREFEIEFRVSQYFDEYDVLKNWSDIIHNQILGTVAVDTIKGSPISPIRSQIIAYQLDKFKQRVYSWTYLGCFLKDLSGISFEGGGDPQIARATFDFITQTQLKLK